MKATSHLDTNHPLVDSDRAVDDAIAQERPRLKAWLRRQVPDPHEVEDILQDAFYEFVVAARLAEPIRHAGAWLFTVIRNRVRDRFRQAGRSRIAVPPQEHDPATSPLFADDEHGERLVDLLPDPADGPEALYRRKCLIRALEEAVQALPADQQQVFIAHEIDGISFKAMSQATGESVNTLLSRKHYAVKSLRKQLQALRHEATGG